VARAALSLDCRLILIDGKRVELGLWRCCAEVFIGPPIAEAIDLLKQLQKAIDTRYGELLDTDRRKITPDCDQLAIFGPLSHIHRPRQRSLNTMIF
jgi:S-DNA-T family DNA segregation ATPase FtsK/SpoIIIE